MGKAQEGTRGAFVDLIAYKDKYLAAQEELNVIEAAAGIKRCSTPENSRSNSAKMKMVPQGRLGRHLVPIWRKHSRRQRLESSTKN
jgi:hypothetical protein